MKQQRGEQWNITVGLVVFCQDVEKYILHCTARGDLWRHGW